jgi:fatty acid-binding protein DegV
MNNESKYLIKKLTYKLETSWFEFFVDILKEKEQDSSDIINISISAHLSSMFNSIKIIAGDNEGIQLNVDNFIDYMTNAMDKIHTIKKV